MYIYVVYVCIYICICKLPSRVLNVIMGLEWRTESSLYTVKKYLPNSKGADAETKCCGSRKVPTTRTFCTQFRRCFSYSVWCYEKSFVICTHYPPISINVHLSEQNSLMVREKNHR